MDTKKLAEVLKTITNCIAVLSDTIVFSEKETNKKIDEALETAPEKKHLHCWSYPLHLGEGHAEIGRAHV